MPNELNPEGSLEQPDQAAGIEGDNTADSELTRLEKFNNEIAERLSPFNFEHTNEGNGEARDGNEEEGTPQTPGRGPIPPGPKPSDGL
jgi:hypothetical protein